MALSNFSLLAAYNKSVNKKMNEVIGALTDEQWNKEILTFFKSIHALCSHVYIADFNWLRRFSARRDFAALHDPCFETGYSFKQTLFADIAEYTAARTVLDKKIAAFAGEVTLKDAESPLRYTDSSGKEFTKNFGDLLLHMFNHETHHRGMISACLETLGKENDYNSLLAVVE